MDLVATVDDVFEAGGPLARMLPGFEPREAQRAMAATVAATIQHDGVAMVEAGTGTGKTLAYLIPAILSGKRVLVSTGTKNLQEQIVDKDLPVLTRVLDRPFTATVMKGRSNYLCLHRYQAMRSGGLPRQQRLGGFGHAGPKSTSASSCRFSSAGSPGPRPEIALNCATCPTTWRSGRSCRRRPRTASAARARSSTSASSPRCGSEPPTLIW